MRNLRLIFILLILSSYSCFTIKSQLRIPENREFSYPTVRSLLTTAYAVADCTQISDLWLHKMSELIDFKPTFADLYNNYSRESLDGMMSVYADKYHEAYGERSQIAGICNPKLKGSNDIDGSIKLLCEILNEELLIHVAAYGVVLCTNLDPIFQWYETYKDNITASSYRWLDITYAILHTPEIKQTVGVSLGLMDSSLQNQESAIKWKARELRNVIHHAIENGSHPNIDSVLARGFIGTYEIMQGELP